MRQRLLLAVVLSVFLMCSGCENNFSPTGDYQKQLGVYGVLSNRSDSQYVRVYTNYNPSGNDPSTQTTDTGVHGAIVTMMDDLTTYRFGETAIPRDDHDSLFFGHRGISWFSMPAAPRENILLGDQLRPGKSNGPGLRSVTRFSFH